MEEKSGFGKVLRTNLLIVLVGALLAGLLNPMTEGFSVIGFAVIYLIQMLVNGIMGFARLGRGPAPYFLSALLVLLIGFGSAAHYLSTQMLMVGCHASQG